MIKKVDMYACYCDNCGRQFQREINGITLGAWPDKSKAGNSATDDGYHENENRHYCPDCFHIDECGCVVIDRTKTEWRDIPGYEDRYQMSKTGRIRSIKELSPGHQVILTDAEGNRENVLVDKLFNLTFIDNENR